VNLCGKLSPRESAAVLARAKLFLGHDSGPMHLAAAVGIPCVAVFSARNRPRMWFPWGSQHEVIYHRTDCWGCDLDTCIEQKKKCLTSILPAEVLGVVHRVLARLSLSHTLVANPR
jgi:lipopolysaccharide heptosyltransferase III